MSCHISNSVPICQHRMGQLVIDLGVWLTEASRSFPHHCRMFIIAISGRPLKILNSVVGFITVEMIDHLFWSGRADKSSGDEPVNEDGTTPVMVKCNVNNWVSPAFALVYYAGGVSYAASITYLVVAFKPFQGDISPFLCHEVLHVNM